MASNIINYIKQSIDPKNETEYIETLFFDLELYNNLIQDGFYITTNKPDSDQVKEYVSIGGYYIIRKVIREIAWLNEAGLFEWDFGNSSIYRRLIPPPVETLNHTLIISNIMIEILKNKKDPVYVEFGIRWGENFKTICNLNTSGINYGVDLDISNVTVYPDNSKLFQMKTLDFIVTESIDLAFIDADHSSSSVIQDFHHLFKHVSSGGYIVLHDTYPCEPMFLSESGCFDCYKVPGYLKKKFHNQMNILTLPLNPGLTIVQKLF